MTIWRLAQYVAVAMLVTGCGLSPVKSELTLLNGDRDAPIPDADFAKLVVFNNSSVSLYGRDGTGRINVWLDDKAVGGPNIGEYLQLRVSKGSHTLRLVHKDSDLLTSVHEIEVKSNPTYVELLARLKSNEINVSDALPAPDLIQKPLVPYRN